MIIIAYINVENMTQASATKHMNEYKEAILTQAPGHKLIAISVRDQPTRIEFHKEGLWAKFVGLVKVLAS